MLLYAILCNIELPYNSTWNLFQKGFYELIIQILQNIHIAVA